MDNIDIQIIIILNEDEEPIKSFVILNDNWIETLTEILDYLSTIRLSYDNFISREVFNITFSGEQVILSYLFQQAD